MLLLVIIILVSFVWYIKNFHDYLLLREDGIVENFQVIILLLALVFFINFFIKNTKYKKVIKIFLLAYIISSFLLLFEEISWGQRIFNFSTPKNLLKINQQQEFNFHNFYFLLPHLEMIMNAGLLFIGGSIFILHAKKSEVSIDLLKLIPTKDIACSLLICSFAWFLTKSRLINLGGTLPELFMQEVYELIMYLCIFTYAAQLNFNKGKK